jgi:hypothetical protein
MLESYFGSIAEALSQVILLREGKLSQESIMKCVLTLSFLTFHTGLADTLTHLGDMVIETTQSKYRLGDGITQKDQQRALDRKMQLFGLLMDELGFLVTRQVSKRIERTSLDYHPHFEINVLLGKGRKHAVW